RFQWLERLDYVIWCLRIRICSARAVACMFEINLKPWSIKRLKLFDLRLRRVILHGAGKGLNRFDLSDLIGFEKLDARFGTLDLQYVDFIIQPLNYADSCVSFCLSFLARGFQFGDLPLFRNCLAFGFS